MSSSSFNESHPISTAQQIEKRLRDIVINVAILSACLYFGGVAVFNFVVWIYIAIAALLLLIMFTFTPFFIKGVKESDYAKTNPMFSAFDKNTLKVVELFKTDYIYRASMFMSLVMISGFSYMVWALYGITFGPIALVSISVIFLLARIYILKKLSNHV